MMTPSFRGDAYLNRAPKALEYLIANSTVGLIVFDRPDWLMNFDSSVGYVAY